MSDLVEFLKARLDEDAAEIAKHPEGEDDDWDLLATAEQNYPCIPYLSIGKKRALAEVEAKRLFLNGHEGVHRCDWGEHRGTDILGYCPTVKRLVLPFATHPDYNESWRP